MKPRVANFTDISRIATMFIKTFGDSKNVKKIQKLRFKIQFDVDADVSRTQGI